MNADDFRTLAAAGLDTEQIAVVIEMMERDRKAFVEAEEERKAKGRERVAKWRLEHPRNVTVTQPNVTVPLTGEGAHVEDKSLPSESIQKKEESKKEPREAALSLDTFWARYPNKVGKPKARAALVVALRKVPLAVIMAGLEAYIATKPPDRAWLNPATFLNQERWADQPAVVVPMSRAGPAQLAPSMSQLFTAIRDHPSANEPGPAEDRSGFRAAISHLRTVGAG